MYQRSRDPGAVNAGASQGKNNGSEREAYKPKPSLALDQKDAVAAIELAKATHPALCRYGMVWEPSQECDETFSVDGVATALLYLRQFPKDHTPRWSSYFLKHRAERWGCRHELDCYVANGEMIAACVYLGLPVSWSGKSPNVSVGVKLSRDYVRRAGRGEVD